MHPVRPIQCTGEQVSPFDIKGIRGIILGLMVEMMASCVRAKRAVKRVARVPHYGRWSLLRLWPSVGWCGWWSPRSVHVVQLA